MMRVIKIEPEDRDKLQDLRVKELHALDEAGRYANEYNELLAQIIFKAGIHRGDNYAVDVHREFIITDIDVPNIKVKE